MRRYMGKEEHRNTELVAPGAPKKKKQAHSHTLDRLLDDFEETVRLFEQVYGDGDRAGAGEERMSDGDARTYERKYNSLWRNVMSFFEDHLAQDSAMLRDKQQILDALVEQNHGDGIAIIRHVLSLLKYVKSVRNKSNAVLFREEFDDYMNVMPEDGLVTISDADLDIMMHDVIQRHIGDGRVYGPDNEDVARVYDAMGIRGGKKKTAKNTRKKRKRKKTRRKTKSKRNSKKL